LRKILDVINLDKYETRILDRGSRQIRQYLPGPLATADNKLFVGQVFSDFVLAIDIETRAVVKRLVIPGGGEGELASASDGRFIYFASNKVPAFFVIDSATYAMDTINYPGTGRGSMSVFAHPFKPRVYIGIQRGGKLNGVSYPGGNSFLAVYDLAKKRYVATHYLPRSSMGRATTALLAVWRMTQKRTFSTSECFNPEKAYGYSTVKKTK
jgi:DNA-binding beta-propeller fold protein YncE